MENTPGPKPDSRRNVFGFLDETGLLMSPEEDRFFALGLLIAHHPSEIHRKIIDYRNKTNYRGEFKFNEITRGAANYQLCAGLVDLLFTCKDTRFHVGVFDKKALNIKSIYQSNYDRAYNSLCGRVIAGALDPSEYIAILADDVSTKKDNNFEKQIKKKVKDKCRRNALFGISRLESHAVAELQLVDVVLGTVAYAFKVKHNLIAPKHDNPKLMMVKHLQNKLKIDNLSEPINKKLKNGARFVVLEA